MKHQANSYSRVPTNTRRGRPCRRCGTPIRFEGQQDRITFWAPSCQPG